MRNKADLKFVRFTAVGGIQLDMEIVEQDPAWMMAARHYDLANPQQFDLALAEYLKYYLGRDQFLTRMPATTGPAQLYGMSAEGPNAIAAQAAAKHSELTRALSLVDDLQAENAWGQHPFYIRDDWWQTVALKDTQLGYWDWVRHRVQSEVESGVLRVVDIPAVAVNDQS